MLTVVPTYTGCHPRYPSYSNAPYAAELSHVFPLGDGPEVSMNKVSHGQYWGGEGGGDEGG